MEERFLTLRDGHKLFFRVWRADGECRSTLHLLHGMAEYSLRYKEFALYLNTLGITVYAQDHRGHGLTKDEDEKGWFAEADGWMTVVKDSWELDQIIMDENENVPHFLMGHSMGSFMARSVASEHSNAFDALIIMGSGCSKGLIGRIGKRMALRDVKKFGSKMPDHKMDNLFFGSYSKKISDKRTDSDWLSRDPEQVDKYIADPLCGFVCSSQFYADLIEGVEMANDRHRAERLAKSMPVLVISGDADPVGDYGRGVKKVYKLYKRVGMSDVTLRLVPGARHELLNETDRDETARYIGDWIQSRLDLLDR